MTGMDKDQFETIWPKERRPARPYDADFSDTEFFPTPTWVTYALMDNEPFEGNVWECACGDGAMSRVIEHFGHPTTSTDWYDRGYGTGGIDFLQAKGEADNIITNPPYALAQRFIERALTIVKYKAAFLLRLGFLESAKRAKTIFKDNPPARVLILSERPTFYPRNIPRRGGGQIPYGWFIWDKDYKGPTILKWSPLGYKQKKEVLELDKLQPVDMAEQEVKEAKVKPEGAKPIGVKRVFPTTSENQG